MISNSFTQLPETTWRAASAPGIELDHHQDRWLVANCSGAMASPAILLNAILVLAEGYFAWPHLYSVAIHRFHPPMAREWDDPLGRRILMPITGPIDRLNGN
jgi:hypothetical protein